MPIQIRLFNDKGVMVREVVLSMRTLDDIQAVLQLARHDAPPHCRATLDIAL